ncbi:MAG: hypothetical protein ACX932_06700 [Gammaproteobacteria bacterium]
MAIAAEVTDNNNIEHDGHTEKLVHLSEFAASLQAEIDEFIAILENAKNRSYTEERRSSSDRETRFNR